MGKLKMNFSQVLLALAVLFGFVACNDEINVTNPEATSYFELYLTDCPYQAEELNVEILKVIVESKDEKKIELETNAGVYNLLDFQDGVDMLIASGDINLEDIKHIYFKLGENNSIVVDGVSHPLIIRSRDRVVKFNADLLDLSNEQFVVDFLACTSVMEKDGKFYLKPVIKFKGRRGHDDDHRGNRVEHKLEKLFKCYKISFPITLIDEAGNEIVASNREELIDAVRNKSIVGVDYPVTLIDKEGGEVVIESMDDWEQAIEACKKSRDDDHNDDDDSNP